MHGRRKFWGWGLEAEVLRAEEVSALEVAYARRFGIVDYDVTPVPRAEEIGLRAPRVTPPESLRDVCTTEHYQRLLHSYGRSFFDSARIFARDFANPPDVVALPRDEREIVAILDWCDSANA
ncbi:MAG: FAD-binding oxidoreductase, partial [Burkholderiales bacterium]